MATINPVIAQFIANPKTADLFGAFQEGKLTALRSRAARGDQEALRELAALDPAAATAIQKQGTLARESEGQRLLSAAIAESQQRGQQVAPIPIPSQQLATGQQPLGDGAIASIEPPPDFGFGQQTNVGSTGTAMAQLERDRPNLAFQLKKDLGVLEKQGDENRKRDWDEKIRLSGTLGRLAQKGPEGVKQAIELATSEIALSRARGEVPPPALGEFIRDMQIDPTVAIQKAVNLGSLNEKAADRAKFQQVAGAEPGVLFDPTDPTKVVRLPLEAGDLPPEKAADIPIFRKEQVFTDENGNPTLLTTDEQGNPITLKISGLRSKDEQARIDSKLEIQKNKREKLDELQQAASIRRGEEAFKKLPAAQIAINSTDKALGALRGGARVGFLNQFLKSARDQSVLLDQARFEMGLDVVSSNTFGPLSEGELNLSLTTAFPLGLSREEGIKFLEKKREFLVKVKQYLTEASKFLSDGGKISDFVRQQEAAVKKRERITVEVE